MYVGTDPCTCGMLVCEGCGLEGGACADGEWCDHEELGFCGGPGSCQPRPTDCPPVDAPVCGCDGVSYPNECEAHAAGTDIAIGGMCGFPDCRTEGCDDASETCQPCRGPGGLIWICLPDGVVC
jgi:hypothetical protein